MDNQFSCTFYCLFISSLYYTGHSRNKELVPFDYNEQIGNDP